MKLFVTGLSHRTAPVAVRERVALAPSELEARVRQVATLPGVSEALIISTCNRVEIYGSFTDAEQAQASLRALLESVLAAGGRLEGLDDPSAAFARHIYVRMRREALHHLFRVTASLDSLVPGEPQILGQMKEAFDLAAKLGTTGPLLSNLFPRAFRVARKVRRDTGLAEQRVSVSSVAVDLARKVWDGFAGRRVLLVGAGKMSDLAARVLQREGAILSVVNRTRARADELAGRLGATAESWDQLGAALVRADIVISSTGAREPVLKRDMMAEVQRSRRGRSLVLIDIAVPRDVEQSVGTLPEVFLFDIDDLQKIVAKNLDGRRQEADRAEAMVEEEITRFMAADRGRGVGPTIAALRTRVQGMARAELERTLAGMPAADERTRRSMQLMIDGLVNKLLHAPSVALKKAAADPESPNLVEATNRLFDLPRVEPVTDNDGDEEPVAATGSDGERS